MKLGMQVGLGRATAHIVLDGDSGPLPPKGHSSPIFDQYLLWPNGWSWMDQDHEMPLGGEVGLCPVTLC